VYRHAGTIFSGLLFVQHWGQILQDLTTNESMNWAKYPHFVVMDEQGLPGQINCRFGSA